MIKNYIKNYVKKTETYAIIISLLMLVLSIFLIFIASLISITANSLIPTSIASGTILDILKL